MLRAGGRFVEVAFRHGADALPQTIYARRFQPWARFAARMESVRFGLAKGFDRLLALDEVPVQLYEHQRHAVLRVLRDMRGRAVLADEVGLGKTIEAGIILKEYMVRGLARKVLVLVPASLTLQWQAELCHKLAIESTVNRRLDGWHAHDCIVTSLDLAKRPEHAARIQEIDWDVVIVDEAHRLKNKRTVAWRFVDGLRKKYLLLLTATPIQNDLQELYNMMTLLQPGLLATYATFKRRFMVDKRTVKHGDALRRRLEQVMVRTTRRQCDLPFPARVVAGLPVDLTAAERTFYDDVVAFARTVYAAENEGRTNVLPLIVLLRELCSSPEAVGRTLRALARGRRLSADHRSWARELAGKAAHLSGRTSKLQAVVDAVRSLNEPAIIFTQFRATQKALGAALESRNIDVTYFHGRLTAAERADAVRRFRGGGVLVSTEAGGEGQNLQFCRNIINYDLPWNPMRIEQRIGRVHRLGQTRDVQIVNVYTRDTIEMYVYELLRDKIRLFHEVIGDLDAIIEAVGGADGQGVADGPSLETLLARLVLQTADDDGFVGQLHDMGAALDRERVRQQRIKVLNEEVFGTDAPAVVGDVAESSARHRVATDEGGGPPVAAVLHRLCTDGAFAAGVLADDACAHPQVAALRDGLARLQFHNVRARPLGRRIVHHRHVLLCFKVAYRSDETREKLHRLLLDPITEQARTLPPLDDDFFVGGGAGTDAGWLGGEDVYGLERLHRQACRQLRAIVAEEGRSQQEEAEARFARDRARLQTYYDDLKKESLLAVDRDLRRLEAARTRAQWRRFVDLPSPAGGKDAAKGDPSDRKVDEVMDTMKQRIAQTVARLDAEQRRRVGEAARKYAVRAEASLLGVAFMLLPRVELRYRLVGPVRQELTFLFDPVWDTFIDLACHVCEKHTESVYVAGQGDLRCPGCANVAIEGKTGTP